MFIVQVLGFQLVDLEAFYILCKLESMLPPQYILVQQRTKLDKT